MKGRCIINGRPAALPDGMPSEARLLHGNYIYATVNVLGGSPLHLPAHLRCAADSYEALYGLRPQLDAADMRRRIIGLLKAAAAGSPGCLVRIYLLPPEPRTDGKYRIAMPAAGETPQPEEEHDDVPPDVILSLESTTIYRGYELHSLRPRALAANYDIPFSSHRTAVRLTAADYIASYAMRNGYHTAIRIGRSGNVIDCGDYPVFVLAGGSLVTPPESDGAPHCAERELMERLCASCGITVEERTVQADELPRAEEIIAFTTTGLRSVLSCGECYYLNLLAARLEARLPELTAEGVRDR